MRGLRIASRALAGIMPFSLAAALPHPVTGAVPGPMRAPYRAEVMATGNARDPYRDIASKGRTGAATRAAQMADAFGKTKVGRRNARGRELSNPFANHKKAQAFEGFLKSLKQVSDNPDWRRRQAIRLARRAV